MKFANNLTRMLLAFSGSVLLLTGCSLMPDEEKLLDPPLMAPVNVDLETYTVKKGDIYKQLIGIGIAEGTTMEHLSFNQSGGLVDKVLVKPGDTVKRGQPLIQLDLQRLPIQLKQAQLDMLQAKYKLDQVGNDPELHEIAALSYQIAQMNYEATQQLHDSRILNAPIDGLVVFVDNLQPGKSVTAYNEVVTIADPTKMWIALDVSESSELSEVEPGMEANLQFNGTAYKGEIVQTPDSAPEAFDEQQSERYTTTLFIEPDSTIPDMQFGANLDVEITIDSRKNTIVIPKRGFRNYSGDSYVQIIEGDSRSEVSVEEGLESSTEVEITAGLTEGQIIILQ